jgi:hypothetical protein
VTRQGVRLGTHQGEYVFEKAIGLHDDETAIAVVSLGARDPEVLFEEHGLGELCQYFELLGDDVAFNAELGPAEGRPDIAARVASEDFATKLQALQAAFALESAANANQVLDTLRSEVKAGGGAVRLIKASKRLERRAAMLRVLHAAQAQPDRSLDELLGEPQPLQQHSGGSDGMRHWLYSPIVLLASPFPRGFTTSRIISEASESYVLVVILPPGSTGPLKLDEATWRQVCSFGLPAWRDGHFAGYDWVKNLNAPAADLDPDLLISWWTDCLNALFTEATDLGRYRFSDGSLDARNAYRELRTLDRIISNCVRIQMDVDNHPGRVAVAFEFFDLLPNLLPRTFKSAHVWSALASPSAALKILNGAFREAPTAIRDVLLDRTNAVTSLLRQETVGTVVPGRRQAGGVRVGNRGKLMQTDAYVAKVLQQLRNTHHGYELAEQAQRDLLDTHTGHVSAAFPELVVLYTLGLAADAARAMNAGWLGSRPV